MFHQTAVRRRAPALSSSSGADSSQRDWANASTVEWSGLNIQPVSSDDAADAAGVQSSARWLLMNAPYAGKLDLLATDQIVYDGMTLEVDGPPRHWPAPGGGWHHTEATLVEEPLTRAGASGSAAAAIRTAGQGAAGRKWSPT